MAEMTGGDMTYTETINHRIFWINTYQKVQWVGFVLTVVLIILESYLPERSAMLGLGIVLIFIVFAGVLKRLLRGDNRIDRKAKVTEMLKDFNATAPGEIFARDNLDSETVEDFLDKLSASYHPDHYDILNVRPYTRISVVKHPSMDGKI